MRPRCGNHCKSQSDDRRPRHRDMGWPATCRAGFVGASHIGRLSWRPLSYQTNGEMSPFVKGFGCGRLGSGAACNGGRRPKASRERNRDGGRHGGATHFASACPLHARASRAYVDQGLILGAVASVASFSQLAARANQNARLRALPPLGWRSREHMSTKKNFCVRKMARHERGSGALEYRQPSAAERIGGASRPCGCPKEKAPRMVGAFRRASLGLGGWGLCPIQIANAVDYQKFPTRRSSPKGLVSDRAFLGGAKDWVRMTRRPRFLSPNLTKMLCT